MKSRAHPSFVPGLKGAMRVDLFYSFRQIVAEECLQAFEVSLFSDLDRLDVAAVQLPKHFWLVGRHKIALGVFEPDRPVFWAMGHQDRHLDPGKLAVGIILNLRHAPDGQPWKHFTADIRDGGKG